MTTDTKQDRDRLRELLETPITSLSRGDLIEVSNCVETLLAAADERDKEKDRADTNYRVICECTAVIDALKAKNERLRELLGDVAGECVAETARGIRLKEEVRATLKEKDVNKHADAQTSCPHGIPHRYACDVCDVPEGVLKGGKYE